MSDSLKAFNAYIRTIEKELALGNATEHTHRSALKALLESLAEGIVATNEPRRIECGAPDFVVTRGSTTIGYVEAKDVGKSLDESERSEQFRRYRDPLTNLVLTDYLEFRWYVGGERRLSACLGTPTRDGRIRRDKAGIEAVTWLLDDFLSHQAEPVGTPRELAQRMAHLAHMIRDLIIAAFEKEPESGSLHAQFVAFRDNLIPDLSTEQFADMYAQTIAYGLFAARCNQSTGIGFTRQNAAYLLPKTNPFLRKLFNHIAGPDLDDRIAWLVNDLAQLLAQADMEAVLKDFGKRTAKEDPMVHFYETFLAAYDPKVREMRGVYYTPEPVVSYIVCSVDHLLKTHFGKPQGLADPGVLVLDPAVGTATFLYMVINEIHDALLSQGQAGLWNDYVAEKLLPRIFGFELLMAPYAMAHLKLGLLLKETGYQFEKEQRLGIYLTNTLEEAVKHSEALFANWITEEANAAAEIKKDKPIMVVLGNPPYSGYSANKGTWARQLLETYKTVDGSPLDEKNPKWLQDDYVKFIRFGQWRIEKTEQGILGFITNHAYLDNPTFRGMRQSLMNTFTNIYILNLHGNVKKREVAPDGGKDENVFDIQQGVAIGLFIKEPEKASPAKVRHADLWGLREGKYHILFETDITTTEWTELEPHSPFYFFLPRDEELLSEYEKGWKVTDIFPVNSVGIVTARDNLTICWSNKGMEDTIHDFASLPPKEAQEKYKLGNDVRDWKVALAQKDLQDTELRHELIVPILYRPFDVRYTYYTGHSRGFHCMPRPEVMRHMLAGENVALLCKRQSRLIPFSYIFASSQITESCVFESAYANNSVLPLYLYPSKPEIASGLYQPGERRPNLNPEFIKAFSDKLGLKFVSDVKGDPGETFCPEDVFNYTYAVFHSPAYRSRYAEFLKTDFPRLPTTSDRELFSALVAKGSELVSLHLMESPKLNNLITKYPIVGPNQVETVRYDEANERVYINKSQYFEGVSPEVWNFHIGGYQVCQKWLKDRKGRTLTFDDLLHYQKIIVILKETIRLMQEIDNLIPGWPIE
ncbi:MAG: N-6 DNA methylase [Dehalococcoidia bacterium]|nr:N-6 DNA methylase [Dehalococcoidia bacterium]